MVDDRRLSRRDRALASITPLVLVVVALVAIVRHQTVDQSPWQGVGFGMFSSYDYLPSRTLRVTITEAGRDERISLPAQLHDHAERARVAPGDGVTRQLARRILDEVGADTVRVQVLGHRVDRSNGELRVELVLVHEVVVEG